jgi:hypothetical protein
MAQFAELLAECIDQMAFQGRRGGTEVTDPRYLPDLLRACGERPCHCRAE